jgi:hypothetical protein
MGKGRFGALVIVVLAAACGGKNGVSASASANAGLGDEPAATSRALAAPVAAPPPPPPVTVSFTRSAPAAGMSHVVRMWVGRKMLFSVDKGIAPVTVEHVSGELDERREDIVAAASNAVTKMKVTFLHKQATVVENGVERTRPSVVQGKSYLVEAKDGSLYITTEQGKRVTQAEGDVIAQGYESLGQPDVIFAGLPARPIAVGESADALVQGIEAAIVRGAQGHVGFGEMSATLRGTRDVAGQTCGVFGVHMQLAYKLDKVENRSDLSGELVVRTSDTMPVSLSLKGPVVMGGQTSKAEVEGQGDARVEVSWAQP